MKTAPPWSTSATVRDQLQRLWDDGTILSARLRREQLFPLELRLRQPTVAEIGERFEAVRDWVRELEAGANAYEIVWREINHRQLGRNRVPDRVLIPSETDALRLLGRGGDARRFDQLAAAALAAFPQLEDWLARRPLALLEQAGAWERILAILQWFVLHPRPALYLRQLDVAGVDSKFIEARKGLLSELLDLVLPPEAVVAHAVGARQFESRYGLLGKPALVRFRLLDPACYIGGLSDLSVPVLQFANLVTDVKHVFITENEINGLAFPSSAAAMVIFGGGYGVDRLADVGWLRERTIDYWGDIDTHGFAILDRLRAHLPQARSMLMDAATLHAHRELWGAEDKDKRYIGQPTRLHPDEMEMYAALRDDVYGVRVRMEQERLGFGWVSAAVRRTGSV